MGTQHWKALCCILTSLNAQKHLPVGRTPCSLRSAVDPLEQWSGTMGCDADGWREDGHLKEASNKVWSAQQTELPLSKILFWWSCCMVQASQLPLS